MRIEEVFDATFKKPETEEKFSSIQRQETEEVLDNLGYISLNRNSEDTDLTDTEIADGIALFRKEYQTCKSAFADQTELDHHGSELTEEELEFLHKISSLDGDFDLEQYSLDEIGKNAILSRVLNWRLCILSIFQDTISPELSDLVPDHLEKLRKWCRVSTIAKVVHLLGDIDQLVQQLAQQDHYADSQYHHIVYFKSDRERLHRARIRIDDDPEWFRSRFGVIPAESIEHFERTILKKERINEVVQDDLNKLMTRLIQIKLWMFGTYRGELDNDMGPLSLQGLSSLMDYIQDNYGDVEGYSMKNLLLSLGHNYWALNATYLFKSFLHVIEEMAKSPENSKAKTETLSQEIGHFISNPAFSDDDRNKILQEINAQFDADFQSAKIRKHKTRGSKSFLRSIGSFLSRIGKMILSGINEVLRALKKLFEWFKNGAKVLLRELKKIYSMIRQGLSFFFSKRKVITQTTSARIISDFDFNFDCVTYISGVDQETIDFHIRKNNEITNALTDASEFLGTVVSIAIKVSLGPFGWIQLGIETIKYLAHHKFGYNRLSYAFE